MRVKLVEYVKNSAFCGLLSLYKQEYVPFVHLACISIAFLVYSNYYLYVR